MGPTPQLWTLDKKVHIRKLTLCHVQQVSGNFVVYELNVEALSLAKT